MRLLQFISTFIKISPYAHSIQPGNGMLKKYLIRNQQSHLPSTFSYLFFKSFSAQASPTLHLIRYFRRSHLTIITLRTCC